MPRHNPARLDTHDASLVPMVNTDVRTAIPCMQQRRQPTMSKRKRTVSLAIRPASKNKKPRTIRKSAITDVDTGESSSPLYAQVFGDNNASLDDVAAAWVNSFQEHEARALAEVVNFVLRAAGCSIRVDEDDVADPDNCPARLAEIQDEYQAVRCCSIAICMRGSWTMRSDK